MDILTNNLITTKEYATQLQLRLDEFTIQRKAIREKITETLKTQMQLMSEETDDIGNPEELCEELTKLRLEYKEIILAEEKASTGIMNDYTKETLSSIEPYKDTDTAMITQLRKQLQEAQQTSTVIKSKRKQKYDNLFSTLTVTTGVANVNGNHFNNPHNPHYKYMTTFPISGNKVGGGRFNNTIQLGHYIWHEMSIIKD